MMMILVSDYHTLYRLICSNAFNHVVVCVLITRGKIFFFVIHCHTGGR